MRITNPFGTNKQFVLAKEAIVADGWMNEKLSSGHILSWEKHLKVLISEDRNVCLLGHSWSVVEEGFDVRKVLTMSREEILNEEKNWSGRYLLIIGKEIYLDAAGLLGVFYDEDIISSSLALIFRIKGRKVVYPKIKHGISLDFVPGEYTECEGVKRLLPSQVLNYTTCTTASRELLPDRDFPQLSDDERTQLFSKYLEIGLRNLQREFPDCKLWLALTGGRDSRTTLAGLAKSGLAFETFTLEHCNIASEDVSLPPILANKLGVRHKYVSRDRKGFSRKEYDAYRDFTAGMAVDEDWLFYAYGQYSQLVEDSKPIVLLRSSIYEIVIFYWTHCLREGQAFTAENLRKVSLSLRCSNEYYNSLSDWFKKTEEYGKNMWMGISNMFHWEARSGCWVSSIEQSFDIYENITSIQPVNSRVYLSLLMGYNPNERREKKHQEHIISTMCPEIGDVPYCEKAQAVKPGLTAKIIRKLRRAPRGIRRRLSALPWIAKNYGIKALVKR